MMPTFGSPAGIRSIVALAVSVATLALAIWIVIPAPTYFLLRLSVGAPEVSAWLVLSALLSGALAAVDASALRHSRLALLVAMAALVLASIPFASFADTAARFQSAMDLTLGADPGRSTARPNGLPFLRSQPLAVTDLFSGVPTGTGRVSRGVPLGDPGGTPLTVDVYQPATPGGPYPIVVQVYGGAWQRGAPGDHGKAARWLASHGYVVFAIDYRHAPQWRWPSQLLDVQAALAWVKDNGVGYEGDTTRVALIGRSAGAHLAMLAAYRPGPLAIRAVVSYYGPVDLVDAYRHPPRPDPLRIRSVQDTLFGGTLEQLPERYREASPIEYADAPRPPTLLLYAARDHIVERRYGRQLAERLAKGGTKAVYLEIPWADHAFDEVFNGPSNQLALYFLERFLARALDGRAITEGCPAC